MVIASSTTISVIIPVYNGGNLFKQCLASLKASQRSPDEVIIVSDGDTDGSWKLGEEFGATVIRLPISGGPARARNIGARAAKGDLLFFVDADVTLHADTLGLIETEFLRSPTLSALIGSYDDEPGAENFLSQYKNLFHHYTHQISSEKASTFWGACGAIRRSAFEQVGGFDESYRRPCIEDIELGYRLKQQGYEIRLCKYIQVKHLKRWEPLNLLRAEIFYRAIPWTELMLRDRQFNADLNLNYANRLSLLMVMALLITLGVSCFWPRMLVLAVVLMCLLLLINRSVYAFFIQKRGFFFTLKVIPWHWFYFVYGGIAFAYATIRYSLQPKD